MSAHAYLTKAKEFDEAGRRSEAIKLYCSGVTELQQTCKALVATDENRKAHYMEKISEYNRRIKHLQLLMPTVHGKVIEKIFIMEGQTGKSYDSVFGKYLDDNVTEVLMDEPYLREHYQLANLVRFCELLVLKCSNLKLISVTTVKHEVQNNDDAQTQAFDELAFSLESTSRRIRLDVRYSESLHDRQIIFNNGFIIKIGRGLHYFKRPQTKYSLGYYNQDLRQCMECNVDVQFCEENKRT